MTKYRTLVALTLCLLFSGCASQLANNFGEVGSHNEMGLEERELWESANIVENEMMAMKPKSKKAVQLQNYLDVLAQRFNSTSAAIGQPLSRISVIKSNEANAFSLPNGAIFITLPMLMNLDSEEELYSVLAHEHSHFYLKHGLKQNIQDRNATRLAAVAGLVIGVLATSYSGYDLINLAQSVTQTFAVASSSGFSKKAELEADKLGIEMLTELQVNPKSGLHVFEKLQRISSEKSVLFATHPKWVKRIASYKLAIDQNADESDFPATDEALFQKIMSNLGELDSAPTEREYILLAENMEEKSESILAVLDILNRFDCEADSRETGAYAKKDIEDRLRAYLELMQRVINFGIEAKKQGRYKEAFVCFYSLKALGAPEFQELQSKALFNIGQLFEEGNGVPRDQNMARYYYRKAEASGSAEAAMKVLGEL